MSLDEYNAKIIYKYSRKTYKNNPNSFIDTFTESRGTEVINTNAAGTVIPMCSCDMDSKGITDGIIHKTCPIITLAYKQRQRVLDETDRIFYDTGTYSRSIYDFLVFFRDVAIGDENRRVCVQILLLVIAFIIGILFGSASCGTHLRKFNSPVLACIDSLFAVDSGKTSEETSIY